MSGEEHDADGEITATWFEHARRSRRGVRITIRPAQLARDMDREHAPDLCGQKQDLPLLCLATFKDEHRGNDRVERVYMLGLDIDEGQPDPDATIERLAGVLGDAEVFAYSTSSSEPGAYRLRALIPYDRPATADEHRACWAMGARMLKRAGIVVDAQCSDPARGFYVWAIPKNRVYWSRHIAGERWNVTLAVDVERDHREAEAEKWQREAEARAQGYRAKGARSREAKIRAARNYVATMPAAISGAGGHDAAWAVMWRLVVYFGLGDADALGLFREYNARCKPPWSEREILHKLESAKKARLHVTSEDR